MLDSGRHSEQPATAGKHVGSSRAADFGMVIVGTATGRGGRVQWHGNAVGGLNHTFHVPTNLLPAHGNEGEAIFVYLDDAYTVAASCRNIDRSHEPECRHVSRRCNANSC